MFWLSAGHLIPASSTSERLVKSPLHRAFSVFIFHPVTGKLLLQKRADEKITFPGMWTNTCCSHPLAVADELVEDNQQGASSHHMLHGGRGCSRELY